MKEIKMIAYNTLTCEPIIKRATDNSLVVICQCDGPTEPSIDNRVYVFRSEDNGQTWDNGNIWHKGKLIIPNDNRAVYQTGVLECGNRLICFLTIHNGSFLDWDCRLVYSDDCGKTWLDGGKNPWFDGFVFIRSAISLKNGKIIIPFQHYPISPKENKELLTCTNKKRWLMSANLDYVETGVLVSCDEGKTFEKKGFINVEFGQNKERNWVWSEPTVCELSNGDIAMLYRKDGDGRLFLVKSSDDGESWSKPIKTDIKNPNNKPKLIRHSDGRIFLINTPNDIKDNRYPLQIWVSFDDMNTWKVYETLMGDVGYYSYPDAYIDEKEGKLYVVYENRHDLFFAKVDV